MIVIAKKNMTKNNQTKIKKLTTAKKIGSGWMPIDVTALERMKKPGYRYINKGLSLNATPLEKSKYEVCQNILAYQQDNKISDQELKKKLAIKQIELDYLLYCHIDKFTLDQLVDYASNLFAPFHLEVTPEKYLLFSLKSPNGRLRKHT